MTKKIILSIGIAAGALIFFTQGTPHFFTAHTSQQARKHTDEPGQDDFPPALDLPEGPADLAEPASELFADPETPPHRDADDDSFGYGDDGEHEQSRRDRIKEKRKVKALSSSLDAPLLDEQGFDVQSAQDYSSPRLQGDQEYGYAPSRAGVNPALLPGVTPSPDTSPDPSPSPLLNNVQARGYTILNLMQAEARNTVDAQVQNLIEANIKRVYLGVLVDGTFSWDEAYFDQIVQRLNEGERELTLVMYITNGSTMRNFEETEIDAGFNKIDPERFRLLVKSYDAETRSKYQSLVRRSLRIFARNRILGEANKNIIIPMLEDNLDAQSYSILRQQTREISGNIAEIYRNPCMKINPRIGCYPGNDEITLGDHVEYHIPEELSRLGLDDGFNLDGTGYKFDFERGVRGISEAQVGQLLDETANRGVSFFGLWRFDRQGIYETEAVPIHPEDRNYAIPTLEHLRRERALLRRGYEEDDQQLEQ